MFYWRWFNRPRHPFARLLIGALGLFLLVGVLALGFVALLAFAAIGAIVAIVRALSRANGTASVSRPAATRRSDVIEGEFVVLPDRTAPIKH